MDFSIWTEKYRPKLLREIIDQKHVVERLKSFVKESRIPHMIFAGPPGTGKTCCAIAIAREIFGENWKQNFQETNASVAPETPIMIRKNGDIKRTCFGEIAKEYFGSNSAKYADVRDLDILSVDKHNQVKFKPVSLISRHKVSKIAKIRYEGGSIKTSLNHSIIVIDKNGNLKSKEVAQLKKGDLLITFKTEINSEKPVLNFEKFKPNLFCNLGCIVKNPKIKAVINDMKLKDDIAWLFGVYLAEGCSSLKKTGTNGCVIFTLSYPSEIEIANNLGDIVENNFNLQSYKTISPSGFKPENLSSVQLRIWNTQLSKFFLDNFYGYSTIKDATTKRVPNFIFNSNLDCKISFLKGYTGDACGKWNENIRYSSSSKENLIDISWLGRISNLETSHFSTESRIIWKSPSSSYIKTEFIPSEPLTYLIEKLGLENKYRCLLRHQLYGKKSKRLSKNVAKKFLEEIAKKHRDKNITNLLKIVNSPLSVVRITDIEIEDYDDFVYDVSVPNIEMFWGGTTPILLHNSDMRGIDVIRNRVKNFSRMKPIGASFKIIFLDEADALTSDAQNALRRLMEMYSDVTRFILSCNYSSNIISPIQSRAVVFRFKSLSKENVFEYMERIIKAEKLKIDEEALEVLYTISEGDLRKATNILQASAVLGKKITEDTIYEVAAKAEPKEVTDMMNHALNGKFLDAREILKELLLKRGISGQDIIKEISNQIYKLEISDKEKVDLIEKVGEFEFRLNQGGNEQLQLEALLSQFTLYGKK